jgi:hypothetical protein
MYFAGGLEGDCGISVEVQLVKPGGTFRNSPERMRSIRSNKLRFHSSGSHDSVCFTHCGGLLLALSAERRGSSFPTPCVAALEIQSPDEVSSPEHLSQPRRASRTYSILVNFLYKPLL